MRILISLLVILLLPSCAKSPSFCTSESAQLSTKAKIRESLESAIGSNVKAVSDSGVQAISASQIKAVIDQVGISISDIRTARTDPNSTMRTCTGSLSIQLPKHVIEDAEVARRRAGFDSIEQLADVNNVRGKQGAYAAEMDFTVQPSDDGNKIYSDILSGHNLIAFSATVVALSLYRPQLDTALNRRMMNEVMRKASTKPREPESFSDFLDRLPDLGAEPNTSKPKDSGLPKQDKGDEWIEKALASREHPVPQDK